MKFEIRGLMIILRQNVYVKQASKFITVTIIIFSKDVLPALIKHNFLYNISIHYYVDIYIII